MAKEQQHSRTPEPRDKSRGTRSMGVDSWEEVRAGATSADGRFTGPCSIARRWTPMEISIVSVPADATVGVGRSSESADTPDLSAYERQIQINQNTFRR